MIPTYLEASFDLIESDDALTLTLKEETRHYELFYCRDSLEVDGKTLTIKVYA